MNTSQFAGPSAIAVFNGTLLLFRSVNLNGNLQSIQLMTAPAPAGIAQGATPATPAFANADVADNNGNVIQGGILGQANQFSAPSAIVVDENTVELIYWRGIHVYGQSFTQIGNGIVRTRAEFQYDVGNISENMRITAGVCTLPGQPAYLVAYNFFDGQTGCIKFEYYRHDDPTDPNAYFHSTLTMPQPTNQLYEARISMAVIRNPNAGATVDASQTPLWPYQILLAYPYAASTASGNSPGFILSSLSLSADGGQGPTIDLTSLETTPGIGNTQAVTLHRGPDGVACMMAIDSVSGGLHFFPVTSVPPTGLARQPEMPASAYSSLTQVPAVFYTCGGFDDSATSSSVAVWRTTMFDLGQAEVLQTCTARRTNLPQADAPSPIGMLIGIIEGGPPVDNSNVAKAEGVGDSVGQMEYSSETDNDTDTSYSVSVGAFAKLSGTVGVPWLDSIKVSAKVEGGISFGGQSLSKVSTLTSIATQTNVTSDAGQYQVDPLGSVLLYVIDSWVGYQYEFLDGSGNPNPLAPVYTQLIPSVAELQPFPFHWDPSYAAGPGRPMPGNLQSYQMDGQTITATDQNACVSASLAPATGTPSSRPSAAGVVNSPYCAWSTGTTLAVEVATLNAYTSTAGAELGLDVAAQAEETGLKGEAGLKLKCQIDGQWGSQSQSKLKSTVDPPDPDAVPGAKYSSYSFYTFMLKPSPDYVNELMAILAYNDALGDNAKLRAMILPNAQPWKITYGVTFE